MGILRILGVAAISFGTALLQTPASAPIEFEVATIKPSAPIDGMGKVMYRFGPRNDGAMVVYERMTLKQLVQNAYGVKDYQVIAAPWMDTLQFDISAKMPDGAAKDQAAQMLQNLLKERFHVALHREKKDHPIYALVAAKGGPKLKLADPNNAFPPSPAGAPAPPPPPPPPGSGPTAGNALAGGGGGGRTMMRMGPSGGHIDARGMTVSRLAETISRYVDRPVIDETHIEGNYDFALDISPEELSNNAGMRNMMSMGSAMASAGGPGGPGRGGPDTPNAPEGGSIFQSIQSYGLKLEPKKASMEMIVVDSAEKTPTEN